MSGVRADTGAKYIQVVVGTRRIGFGRDTDGGLGGGTDGVRGVNGQDIEIYGDRYGLNWWGDNVANIRLWTELNDPLAYAPVLEHHHMIMSTIRCPRVRLERERDMLQGFSHE